jgi:hypothetical protein
MWPGAQARLQTCAQLLPRRSTALSVLAPCGASALASERARWPNGEGVGFWSRRSQARVLGGSVLSRGHYFSPPGAAWKMSLRWDSSPRPPACWAGALSTRLKRLARGKAIPLVGWAPVFSPTLRVPLVRTPFRWSLAALTATLCGCDTATPCPPPSLLASCWRPRLLSVFELSRSKRFLLRRVTGQAL